MLEYWNIGVMECWVQALEKWKNGKMGNGLGKKSLIHFVRFYLRFLYKLKPNIPVFQYSIIPFCTTHYSILPAFQHSG